MKLTSFMLKISTFLVSSYLIISMATASYLIEEKENVRKRVQHIVNKHNSSSSRGTQSLEQEESFVTKANVAAIYNLSSLAARFRLTGVRSISSWINHFSINTVSSTNPDFIPNIIGTGISSKDMPSRLQQQMKSDDFLSRLYDMLTPQVQIFLENTKTVYGSNPKDWPLKQNNDIYVVDSKPETGHAFITFSFNKCHDPKNMMETSGRSSLIFDAGFPSGSRYLRPEIYFRALGYGLVRSIDGSLENPYSEDIQNQLSDYNQRIRLDGNDPSGIQLLGTNSYINNDNFQRFSNNESTLNITLKTTLGIHALDGSALWMSLSHPDFPEGVVNMSLHVGEHSIPGGDFIGGIMTSYLAKNIFNFGTIVADSYGDLEKTFGKEKTAYLLDDPEVRNEIYKAVGVIDPTILTYRKILSAADKSGVVVSVARYLLGFNEVATFSEDQLDDLNKYKDNSQLAKAIDQGIQRTSDEGYQGIGGIETTDPTVTVPDLSEFLDTNPMPVQNNPLFDEYKELAGKIQDMSKDLDWNYIQEQFEGYVRDNIQRTLDRSNPDTLVSQSLQDSLNLISIENVTQEVRSKLNDLVPSMLMGQDDYALIISEINLGQDYSDTLANMSIVDPLLTRASQTSYLSATIEKYVSTYVQHVISQRGDPVERQKEAQQRYGQTEDEIKAKQTALDQVKELLQKDPDNPTYQQEAQDLQNQIDDDVKKAEQAQRDEDAAAREENLNKDASDKIENADKDINDTKDEVYPE